MDPLPIFFWKTFHTLLPGFFVHRDIFKGFIFITKILLYWLRVFKPTKTVLVSGDWNLYSVKPLGAKRKKNSSDRNLKFVLLKIEIKNKHWKRLRRRSLLRGRQQTWHVFPNKFFAKRDIRTNEKCKKDIERRPLV